MYTQASCENCTHCATKNCATDYATGYVTETIDNIERFMSEPNEGGWNILKRLIWYLVGHGILVQVISRTEVWECATRGYRQRLQDAYLFERVRQRLIFFTASIYPKLEVGRKVHEVCVL